MSDKMRVLQRGYELIWRENRLEDAVRGLADDFEWVAPGMPEGDVRRGGEGVLGFFRDWTEPFEGLEVEWDLREADGERVLAIVETRGRGHASGVPVEMRFAQLWTWRDDRFVRMVLYPDVDEALRAAGLATKSPTQLAYEGTAAYRQGGIDAVLPMLAEDVVWEEDPEWPDGETWHGREGVRRAFRQRLESTTITPEIEEVVERGRHALVLMRWVAEGHGSGAVADLHMGVIYEYEGELIKRARFFLDQGRAREAFG
jgi:ketosteroid isomerase-like protein